MNTWPMICDIMQQDQDRFVVWASNNRLRLNESKTQSMIVGNKLSKIKDPTRYTIRGKYIKHVIRYNYLGIELYSEQSLTVLCKNVEKRVMDKVFMLRKIRKYLTYKASLQICKQTISPIFDYLGFLLLACNRDKKHNYQVIQNDVLRFCDNKRLEDRFRLDYCTKRVKRVIYLA